jgi:uncharacterized protein (TIGR02117 family)
MPITWSKLTQRATDMLLGLLALLLTYLAAGYVGGAIPVNADWRPPDHGILIYLETNGVHTDLIVPVSAGGIDWRGLIRPEDIADPRYAAFDHLAIGWGDRRFYLETPTWADLRPGPVFEAAIGSDRTLMHVEHLPAPSPGPDVRPILLRPAEYRRLAAFIRASFAPAAPGRRPQVFRGYDVHDAFYTASGQYESVTTCNAWTGAALRHAGVRVGAWTPFAMTVMGWF